MRYRNGWVADSYISARNLSKVYTSGGADLVVFSELNLDVERGEMLALVGESGAGKSTLLHLLGGLDRPSSGTICYGSTEVSRLADSEQADFRNREIGFVWQIHYLLPEFTALENVMMPLLIRGWEHTRAAAESLARLEEVGLRARASHRAGELSGGEQQRVVLARALVGSPSVLLADEPSGNLDFRTGEMIFELLAGLHRALGDHSVQGCDQTHMAIGDGGGTQLCFGGQHFGIVGDVGAVDRYEAGLRRLAAAFALPDDVRFQDHPMRNGYTGLVHRTENLTSEAQAFGSHSFRIRPSGHFCAANENRAAIGLNERVQAEIPRNSRPEAGRHARPLTCQNRTGSQELSSRPIHSICPPPRRGTTPLTRARRQTAGSSPAG